MNQNFVSDNFLEPDLFLYSARFEGQKALNSQHEGALLSWLYEKADEIKRREWARKFMNFMIEDALIETVEDDQAHRNLIDLFADLEKVFRLAISIESPHVAIRDHLNHTIRDFLLGEFILRKLQPKVELHPLQRFIIATLFHDVAYPVEKVKLAAEKIQLLPKFLKTQHRQEFEIMGSHDLLNILHVIGSLDFEPYKTIYQQMLCPAIAGKGMYEIRHNLSSVVMFLYPIVCQKQDDALYWQRQKEALGAICFAIAFHDRKMWPTVPIGQIARALRIADELQEWDRSSGGFAYFNSIRIKDSNGILFEMDFDIKVGSNDSNFKHEVMVADKLIGLVPACDEKKIKLTFVFSKPLNDSFKEDLIDVLQKRWTKDFFLNRKFVSDTALLDWDTMIAFQGSVARCNKIEILVAGMIDKTEVRFHGLST